MVHHHWEALADGVRRCRLPFLDVTVGLVHGRDGSLLIDCGTTLSEAEVIDADVRELTGGAITGVVMTHHHFDHVLGSAGFPGAQRYGAAAVAEALTTRLARVREDALGYGAPAGEVDRTVAAACPPQHVITAPVELDLGGLMAHVEHPGRGHTDHDLVVVVPGRPTVVFCGDLVEESADPAIDAESDVGAWPATLDRLLVLGGPDAVYVPGHGAAVDATFVSRQRDWLSARG